MSTPEEIRAKRLARLAVFSNQNAGKKSPSPKPTTNQKPVEPTHTPAAKPSPVVKSKSLHPATSKNIKPQQSIESWTNSQLEFMLHASLSKEKANVKGFFHLASLADEGLSQLTFEQIDSAFLELLTEQGISSKFTSPLDYLLTTWKNASGIKRTIRNDDSQLSQKQHIVNEVLRLSSSYTLIIFQVPDMFVDETTIDATVQTFWKQINKYDGMLLEVVERAIENDSVLELCNIVIPRLSHTLSIIDYTTDAEYMKILDVLQLFLSNKAVASIFHEIDGYHPDGLKAHQFETKTLLGPFLRISPLLTSIAAFNYTDGITKSQTRSIDESLQAEHTMSANRLFSLCDKLVRAGGAARQAFLKLLADIVNKNHLRRGSHADPRKNASDSFMINLTLILVKFAQPFLATLNPKMLEKIDIHYLSQRNKLLDLTEETKINSTIQEYDEHYTDDKLTDKPLNFISDCFYLLLAYIHYGIGGIYISADRVKSGVKQLTEQLKKVEAMLQKAGSQAQTNPLMKIMIETKVNPLKKELHNLKAMKCAIEMFASNRNMQMEVFDIIIGSVTFFMKLVDPTHKYPSVPFQIPLRNMDDDVDKLDDIEYLRSISPVPFKYYPEMFIEGIVNYCHYISKYGNNPMFQNEEKLNKFVEFSITILRCPELVKKVI
ncbi:unnamed protein product [Ambrosiozyma monospora]|uniref:Unnamed protein product n=1 Tax=Ambrosiozyma monospora TaxID=43982 RepID=A0A9W7DHF8_AMBMO|nr:unnamed protein product [Ambrosiozyma monospora]